MIVDVTISRRSFVFGQSHVFGSVACVESTSLLLTPQSKACVQREEVMKLDLHVTGIATMIIIIIVIIIIRHFHISHNAPCLLPKILHKHCFEFLFGRL